MKKYEQLGKKLTREEQKAVGGGFTQVANTYCTCADPRDSAPVCGVNCLDVYAQCDYVCGGQVINYGTCTYAGACW
jgi:hypothetical protein